MSKTFTKLFSSITESTIWQEPAEIRVVWITMLAMADRHGRIFSSIPGLASRAQVTLAQAEEALKRFLAPDRYSRTKDHEGRRIEEIPDGWFLLNHAKYRDMRDEEGRRKYNAEWMRKKRQQEKNGQVDESGQDESTVDDVDSSGPPLAQAYASTDASTDKEKKDQKSALTSDALRPDDLFGFGLEYLVTHNVKDKAARSFLGMMRKSVGNERAMQLLIEADKEEVSDPVAWLTAAMKVGKKSSPAAATFADKKYVGTPEDKRERLF